MRQCPVGSTWPSTAVHLSARSQLRGGVGAPTVPVPDGADAGRAGTEEEEESPPLHPLGRYLAGFSLFSPWMGDHPAIPGQ